MQFSEKNAQPDKFGLAHCIYIYIYSQQDTGLGWPEANCFQISAPKPR